MILEPNLLFSQYLDHLIFTRDLPKDVAEHLIHTYGTSSTRIVELGESNKLKGNSGTNDRVHPDYPFLKSEISYASKNEMAVKASDIICRRVPIAFLNKEAAV
jgi:glycerol-3-phosphate dehydrogenase